MCSVFLVRLDVAADAAAGAAVARVAEAARSVGECRRQRNAKSPLCSACADDAVAVVAAAVDYDRLM